MTQPPYLDAAPSDNAPTGIVLFRVYAGLQTLLFLFLVLVGVFLIVSPSVWPTVFPVKPGDPPPQLIGAILAVLYLIPLVVFAVGVFVPRRPWAYVFGIVACAMSMTCGGCWMMAIPALIYWLKPETKAWLESGPR
jgi:hypothetical protein